MKIYLISCCVPKTAFPVSCEVIISPFDAHFYFLNLHADLFGTMNICFCSLHKGSTYESGRSPAEQFFKLYLGDFFFTCFFHQTNIWSVG